MTLGVFDSGLGGLLISSAIQKSMPSLNILYLGDTLHLPYGKRSAKAVYNYTRAGIDFLFDQGCQLIIVACNTASASALRQLQQIYLPKFYPDRRLLGVIVPTLEVTVEQGCKRIGVLGTSNIVAGGIYKDELSKIDPDIHIFQQAAPLLVPLIEDGGHQYCQPILKDYIAPLLDHEIDSLILGCTHYPYLKKEISDIVGSYVTVISQDELIPSKLQNYLDRHENLNKAIIYKGQRRFCLTDITQNYKDTAAKMFGHSLELEHVSLSPYSFDDDFVADLERARS